MLECSVETILLLESRKVKLKLEVNENLDDVLRYLQNGGSAC